MHIVPRVVIASSILALFGSVHVASAQSGSKLAEKKLCMACHKMSEKSLGPAIKDIAKKYRGAANAEATLAAKIKQGGKGVWGSVPMPPQSTLSDAELKTLAAWVLSVP